MENFICFRQSYLTIRVDSFRPFFEQKLVLQILQINKNKNYLFY